MIILFLTMCVYVKGAEFVSGRLQNIENERFGSFFTQLGCCSPQIYSIWKRAAALTAEAGTAQDSHLDLSEPFKVCSC